MAISPQTAQQLQARLQAVRATGNPAPAPVAPTSTAPVAPGTAGMDPARLEALKSSLSGYDSKKKAGTLPATAIPKDNPSALAEMAKSLFTAPTTIVARPFQAVAELAGATSDQVDAATKKIPLVGGLIAPVPQNAADVGKDVGRGIQTAALGVSEAPLAAGALFGAGASLEQGNSLLSAQTAVDAALGAAGGKVLDWVGKPLLNAAGKVVGTITPKVIKDVTAGGADVIRKFAADHQLLGGVVAKPAAAFEKTLQGVDKGINAGIDKTAAGLKKTAAEQFPGFNAADHYTAINQKDLLRPTTVNEPRFGKAQAIYADAQGRKIDLGKVATDQGIIHDKIAEGGKYNTTDVVDNLRQGNYRASKTLLRPALKASEPGVALVPISDVRTAMVDRINKLPATEVDAEERAKMIQQVTKRYADNSPEAKAHPNGYSLTDLTDNRITQQGKGKFIPGVSDPATTLAAKRARAEAQAFSTLFDIAAPNDLPAKAFKNELEKNFILADYLESLHGKKVPQGITQKAVRLFGRGLGGVLGSKVGGFPGFLVGSRGGDMIFNSFETMPNPVKIAVLQSVKHSDPAVYKALTEYIGKQETDSLSRLALPPAGGSSFKETKPTLFTTPGGVSTPDKGAAIDLTAVEKGAAKTTAGVGKKPMVMKIGKNPTLSELHTPHDKLPVIQLGPKTSDTAVAATQRHITEAQMVLQNLPAEEIAKLGGEKALVKNLSRNIVDGLKAEGMNEAAKAASAVSITKYPTVKAFAAEVQRAVKGIKTLKEIF